MTPAPPPQGDYAPVVRHGRLIVTAGMTSRVRGEATFLGTIGADLDEDDARRAVRIATRNAADAVRSVLRPGEAVEALLRLTVYLACTAGFTRHSALADEASSCLREQWSGAGIGARTAVGVGSLPGGQPVEVELVAMAADYADDHRFT
jgi:enamine deaminase RidA (YjgF/YER057c/UK114 family)